MNTKLSNSEMIESDDCYSVSLTPTGLILVGKNKEFGVQKVKGRVASVRVSQGKVSSIQYYNGEIYILCGDDGLVSQMLYHSIGLGEGSVIVYNSDSFDEVRKWTVPNARSMRSMAIINKKVYVSDTYNKQLCVYSLTGTPITEIKHSTFSKPKYLTVSIPDSIIISDSGANKVYKLYTMDDEITWTCSKVNLPGGVCCHVNGDVFVWSQSTKSLFLLSSVTGESIIALK